MVRLCGSIRKEKGEAFRSSSNQNNTNLYVILKRSGVTPNAFRLVFDMFPANILDTNESVSCRP